MPGKERVEPDIAATRQRTILPLANSTIAFALALLVMITVHELGHALAALAQGHDPILRPSSVDTGSAPGAEQVVTNAAGPLVSLVTGLLVLALPQRGSAFTRLFVLWFGLLSVQEFNGYLITGPFVADGDIGVVLKQSGAPGWLGFVLLAWGWPRPCSWGGWPPPACCGLSTRPATRPISCAGSGSSPGCSERCWRC